MRSQKLVPKKTGGTINRANNHKKGKNKRRS